MLSSASATRYSVLEGWWGVAIVFINCWKRVAVWLLEGQVSDMTLIFRPVLSSLISHKSNTWFGKLTFWSPKSLLHFNSRVYYFIPSQNLWMIQKRWITLLPILIWRSRLEPWFKGITTAHSECTLVVVKIGCFIKIQLDTDFLNQRYNIRQHLKTCCIMITFW